MSAVQEAMTWESPHGWSLRGRSRDAPMREGDALKLSAFYRAVDLRSDSIGRLPLKVWDLNVRREAEGHYLGPVLWGRPNEAMTPFTYKKLVEYQRLVLGNCYVWVYRDRDGRPVELLPLPPGTCTPCVQPDSGKLWYVAQDPKTHQLYWLDPADILHFKGFSTNGIEGASLLAHAARTLRVAESREQYEQESYENWSAPAGVLYTDADLARKGKVKLPDGTEGTYYDAVRFEWEKVHRGAGNRLRVAVLDNSLKFQPITMNNSEAQFVESKAVSVEDIARFCAVPLHLLFAGKQSYESNEQNSLDYVKYCLQPAVTQYEEEYSAKLLTASERRRGLWVQVNMMAELRGDTASRRDWFKAMREAGVFSVNDIRRLEDLEDVPGGDLRYASLNYVPLRDFAELSRLRAESGGQKEAAPEPERTEGRKNRE